jgi:hypothetical protein
MKRWTLGKSLFAIVAFLVLAQLIPVKRTNPPVETEVTAPAAVKEVLRKACYDCHSNETVWPWYSKIAPSSWLVWSDVHEARGEFNFSTWNRLDEKKRAKVRKRCWKEVSENDMPPWIYRLAHRKARLSIRDLDLIKEWSTSPEQSKTARIRPQGEASPQENF